MIVIELAVGGWELGFHLYILVSHCLPNAIAGGGGTLTVTLTLVMCMH